jgi:hypothetical protein
MTAFLNSVRIERTFVVPAAIGMNKSRHEPKFDQTTIMRKRPHGTASGVVSSDALFRVIR